MYKVPDWHSMSRKEKDELVGKALTFYETWCTVRKDSDYDLFRQKLVNDIVTTGFMHVPAANVLTYWVDYVNEYIVTVDPNYIKKWLRILWLDVIYMLINYHPELQLHTTIKMVMIKNYVDLMEA